MTFLEKLIFKQEDTCLIKDRNEAIHEINNYLKQEEEEKKRNEEMKIIFHIFASLGEIEILNYLLNNHLNYVDLEEKFAICGYSNRGRKLKSKDQKQTLFLRVLKSFHKRRNEINEEEMEKRKLFFTCFAKISYSFNAIADGYIHMARIGSVTVLKEMFQYNVMKKEDVDKTIGGEVNNNNNNNDNDNTSEEGALNNTALMEAAMRGKNQVLLCLLNHGADVRKINKFGNTALHKVVSHPNSQISMECVLTLLNNGGELKTRDKHGQTALHRLVHNNNNNSLLLYFLKEKEKYMEELNMIDNMGRNLFHEACLCGCFNLIELLVNYNIYDVNEKDKDGNTGLYLLLQSQRPNVEIIKYLLNNQSSPTILNNKLSNAYFYIPCAESCQLLCDHLNNNNNISSSNVILNTFLHENEDKENCITSSIMGKKSPYIVVILLETLFSTLIHNNNNNNIRKIMERINETKEIESKDSIYHTLARGEEFSKCFAQLIALSLYGYDDDDDDDEKEITNYLNSTLLKQVNSMGKTIVFIAVEENSALILRILFNAINWKNNIKNNSINGDNIEEFIEKIMICNEEDEGEQSNVRGLLEENEYKSMLDVVLEK